MTRRPMLMATLGALLSGMLGCSSRGEASILLPFVGSADVQGLSGVRARLTLTDAKGGHPTLTLRGSGDGEALAVEGLDVPLPCTGDACGATVVIDPGSYAVTLTLSAQDRCRVRGDVLTFSGDVAIGQWETATVVLEPSNASFDADDDGVIDILEAATCGRFDLDEGTLPARVCGPGREACCLDTSPLAGAQMLFAGGPVEVPYDRDGLAGNDVVDVAPFALDSTEFTWGALSRCVAAGVCLAGRPDHPARQRLDAGVDPRLPVQGVSPADAAVACAYTGRRLPTDPEWFFAAAVRDGGAIARYPFDADGLTVGCLPEDPPPSARYRAAGRACGDGEPLPVGSYPGTVVDRGTGAPVADLAGNVAEWTLFGDADGTDLDGDGLLDGASAIGLRGGGATSFVQLLENELLVVFDADDVVDVARLGAAAGVAGFRCASGALVEVQEEPACPAPEADEGGSDGRASVEPTDPGTGADGSSGPSP